MFKSGTTISGLYGPNTFSDVKQSPLMDQAMSHRSNQKQRKNSELKYKDITKPHEAIMSPRSPISNISSCNSPRTIYTAHQQSSKHLNRNVKTRDSKRTHTMIDSEFEKETAAFRDSETERINECLANNDLYVNPIYVTWRESDKISELRAKCVNEERKYNYLRLKVLKTQNEMKHLKCKLIPLEKGIDYKSKLKTIDEAITTTIVKIDYALISNEMYNNMIKRNRISILNLKKAIACMKEQMANYNSAIVDNAELLIKNDSEAKDNTNKAKVMQEDMTEQERKLMLSLREPILNDFVNAIKYNITTKHIDQQKQQMIENKLEEKHEQKMLQFKQHYKNINNLLSYNNQLEKDLKQYESMLIPIKTAYGVNSISELNQKCSDKLKDRSDELNSKIADIRKLISMKEQQYEDLKQKAISMMRCKDIPENIEKAKYKEFENKSILQTRELNQLNSKINVLEMFILKAITFTKRACNALNMKIDITSQNVVDQFYRYSIAIKTYYSLINAYDILLVPNNENTKHSSPKSSSISTKRRNSSIFKSKSIVPESNYLMMGNSDESIIYEYQEFKIKLKDKAKPVIKHKRVSECKKSIMEYKVDAILKKSHIKVSSISKKTNDPSNICIEKMLRSIYCKSGQFKM